MSNTYDEGDLIRCSGSFETSASVAVDPTAVYVQIMDPSGGTSTCTYGVEAGVVKAETGKYYVDVDATAYGVWHYNWYSTGTAQGSGEQVFNVRKSAF